MIIDTHQHFWKLARGDYTWLTADLEALYRDFLPEDLAPILRENGIDGTIAVQAADSEAETEYLLALAAQYDWILGVVGWVALDASHAPTSIARLAQNRKLVGLRPMIQDIEDDAWMLGENLRPAIKAMLAHDLTFDALVMPRHLSHLKTFLARYPQLRVVIDHGAKPEIRNQGFDIWAAQIEEIAQFPQVLCKLSGLVTEAKPDWTREDISPYIAHILQTFEASRTLFGSDWPVLNLHATYEGWLAEVLAHLDHLPQASQAQITGGTARKAYPRINLKHNAHLASH